MKEDGKKVEKKLILVVSFCFCLFMAPDIVFSRDIDEISKKNNELIILTYNVRNCHGIDNKAVYLRVADIITRINPQITFRFGLRFGWGDNNCYGVLMKLPAASSGVSKYKPQKANLAASCGELTPKEKMEKVSEKSKELAKDGFKIIRGPRKTGDGYYEFETLDPDNNKIEVSTRFVE